MIAFKSTLTCPECGCKKEEEMPSDSCQFFYECENCKNILRPKEGDCCVYCSFGSVKCPSIQQNQNTVLNTISKKRMEEQLQNG